MLHRRAASRSRAGARAAALLVVLASLGSLGCVGFVAHYTDQQFVSRPYIGWSDGRVWIGDSPDRVNAADPRAGGWTEQPATREQVEQYWGTPDDVEWLGEGEQRWTYFGELRWNGVMFALVLVPVPLMLPVGHDRVTFFIREGRLAGAEIITGERASALLGVNIANPGPCFEVKLARFELSAHDASSARFLERPEPAEARGAP